MKILPTVPAHRNNAEQQVVVCNKTGISFSINMMQLPAISEGFKQYKVPVLEFSSPFSYWSNIKAYCLAPRAWLELQPVEVLAGLFIGAYQQYDLLDLNVLSAVEANAIIRTANKEVIITLLQYAGKMTSKGAAGLPVLYIEWAEIKSFNTADSILSVYAKRLKPYFNQAVAEEQRIQAIKARNTQTAYEKVMQRQGRVLAGGVYLAGKKSLSQHEKEFNAALQANKKQFKQLASTLLDQNKITKAMHTLLVGLSVARNLVAVNSGLRAQLQDKFKDDSYGVEGREICRILNESVNPYDIFAEAEVSLERASDAFEPIKHNVTGLSIAQILARKKQAPMQEASEEDNHGDNQEDLEEAELEEDEDSSFLNGSDF